MVPHHRLERIRVLRIIARLNIGGPARHLAQAAHLDPARYDVLLLAGAPGPDEGSMADLLADAPGRLVYISQMGRRVALLSDLMSFGRILREIWRFRPHIVETHTAKAGALGRVAAWLLRVPVIIHTFHGHVFHSYFDAFRSALVVWVERGLAWVSNRLVAVSDQVAADLLKYKIAPRQKIAVVPLGLTLDEFATPAPTARAALRDELGIATGVPLILTVGRMAPVKHQALFVQLAQHWVAEGRDGQFMIVGDGELRPKLEAQIATAGLTDRVTLTGWRRDLPAVLAAGDVFVNTSRNEGTPVAVIEAMAAGLPVVATNVGGLPDVVTDGETGWLTPPDDPAALVQAVAQALADGGQVARAGQQAVLARFQPERLLNDLDALYRHALHEARPHWQLP